MRVRQASRRSLQPQDHAAQRVTSSTARLPIGNDNGGYGYLKEYPHQSKLDNYAKDQRNKVWRPSFPAYALLRQCSKNRRHRNVGLYEHVEQINVPNDPQSFKNVKVGRSAKS